MGKPLDQESRVLGIFKITELYALIFVFIIGLLFLPRFVRILGAGVSLGLFASVLLLLVTYFIISSGLPDNHLLNMVVFKKDVQNFYPGRETTKEDRSK